jgi:hypothetical protein
VNAGAAAALALIAVAVTFATWEGWDRRRRGRRLLERAPRAVEVLRDRAIELELRLAAVREDYSELRDAVDRFVDELNRALIVDGEHDEFDALDDVAEALRAFDRAPA